MTENILLLHSIDISLNLNKNLNYNDFYDRHYSSCFIMEDVEDVDLIQSIHHIPIQINDEDKFLGYNK